MKRVCRFDFVDIQIVKGDFLNNIHFVLRTVAVKI